MGIEMLSTGTKGCGDGIQGEPVVEDGEVISGIRGNGPDAGLSEAAPEPRKRGLLNTWAPLWSKIVESSLWDEPDFVVKIFLTMLAKKDADHVCRLDTYQLHFFSRKSEEEVVKALDILSSPDTKRKRPQQAHEGRRIARVDDGWLILNGQFYRDLMQKEKRKVQQAEWQRSYRERKKIEPNIPTAAEKLAIENGEV